MMLPSCRYKSAQMYLVKQTGFSSSEFPLLQQIFHWKSESHIKQAILFPQQASPLQFVPPLNMSNAFPLEH